MAKAATSCMRKLVSVAGNEDIEPHIPLLVDCMAHPDAVPDTVKKISSTTFVQDMTGPALAVMIPLLVRALNERTTAILRPTTIIIDNLCKLVKDPAEAGQFLPQLLPGLDKIIETAAIPEVRELAQNAKTTLQRVGGTELSHHHEDQEKKIVQTEQNILTKVTKAMSKEVFVDSFAQVSLEYLSKVVAELIFQDSFKEAVWKEFVSGYLSSFLLPNQSVTPFYKDYYDFYLQEYKVRSYLEEFWIIYELNNFENRNERLQAMKLITRMARNFATVNFLWLMDLVCC